MKLCLLYFCMSFALLFAERGIVVTMNDNYAEAFFLGSLAHLRQEVKCTLPIEIWHDGDELTERVKDRLRQFSNIVFCDFQEVFHGTFGSLRGWHAKPFMLIATRFDEICLMDADVYFFDDPEKMFSNQKYMESGAYFFRDRWMTFPGVISACEYEKRSNMFRHFIKKPSKNVPLPFHSIWGQRQDPQLVDLQESGCIFIDKKRHTRGIANIIELTKQKDYVYSCVFGDKETYWMGLEMNKEPYVFNDIVPCTFKSKGRVSATIQFVDGRLFYQQKYPKEIFSDAQFFGMTDDRISWERPVTEEERHALQIVYQYYIESCPLKSGPWGVAD